MRTTLDIAHDVMVAARELARSRPITPDSVRRALEVTDALLLTVARRAGLKLVTLDSGLAELAGTGDVELLRR